MEAVDHAGRPRTRSWGGEPVSISAFSAFSAVSAWFLFAGCSNAPASKSGRIDDPARPAVVHAPEVGDRHEFASVQLCRTGQWARYRIRTDGRDREITIGVARRDGDAAWIEIVEEGEPRRASLRRVRDDGTVVKAWYREIAARDGPDPAAPQAVVPADFDPAPPADYDTAAAAAGEDGSAGSPVRTLTWTFVRRDDGLGRESREVHVLGEGVPALYSGTATHGLLQLDRKGMSVSLAAYGTGYSPAIPVP